MALAAGARLGAYEILSALGAGGMGEVYRARDTRLKREVAIKVLPEAFAQDADRLARFRREAELLASLNHPNIAAIYGLEESDGVRALVLELVEGPTLAERLADVRRALSGPPVKSDLIRSGPRTAGLPLDETLAIVRQIADALEAAHEKGVVHRDLKPANVKVTADGTVKVLDFGLAKALEAPSVSDLSQSPTMTSPAMTGMGIILGTAAYMSPEQARGKTVDKRADIWAFGAVLFEMLTGRRAFEGDDMSITLAAVMMKEPDWKALPSATPPGLRLLLRRCLEREPKRRLRDIGEGRVQLEDLVSGRLEPVAASPIPNALPLWRRALPWVAAASAMVVAAGTVLAWWAPGQKTIPRVPVRLEAALGVDVSLVTDQGPAVALSPDGNLLALVAQSAGGVPQLYIRRLDQLEATPLSGTVEARNPFFSPDGQWIGFFADGKLKKISVTGGATVTLCDAPNGRGGAWEDSATIVFMPNQSGTGAVLQRVSSAGGTPEPLTTLGEGEAGQRWPQVLPGGRAVLYTAPRTAGSFADANIVAQPLPSGPRKVLVRGGYFGRYLPSGHLVYVHDGTLFAAPFDLRRLELAGSFLPVLEHVVASLTVGAAQLALSDTGTVAYLSGQSGGAAAPVVWLDRNGKTTPLRAMSTDWSNPQFSPDGHRLALDVNDGKQTDVWVYDWARDAPMRLTLEAGEHWMPVWTPDGRRIVFRWLPPGSTSGLHWRRADGGGDVQRLTSSSSLQYLGSWHPSGKFLIFVDLSGATNFDLMMLPMDGDEASGWKPGKPTPFLNTPAAEGWPAFSPDGRWIAYQSNESGRNEVYVRPFPKPGGKWQVSTAGGTFPVWSRVRNELLYAAPDNRIMVVSYAALPDSFAADKPRLWADVRFSPRPRGQLGNIGRPFDLHPDGDRVAIAPVPENQSTAKQDKLVFIFNFFDELRRTVLAARK